MGWVLSSRTLFLCSSNVVKIWDLQSQMEMFWRGFWLRFLFFRVQQGHWLPGGILGMNGHCKLWVIWIPWQQAEGNQTGALWEVAAGKRRPSMQTWSPWGMSQVAPASKCRQSWALPALGQGSHHRLQCLFKYSQVRFKGSMIFVAGCEFTHIADQLFGMNLAYSRGTDRQSLPWGFCSHHHNEKQLPEVIVIC